MICPEAQSLSDNLRRKGVRVVFAESCTAGMVSGLLAAVPGISEHLCGSIVTYRMECKRDWLEVPADVIERYTTVSSSVSQRMALSVLEKTPIADLAAAVTGHLGPDAPDELDGAVFLAAARRVGPTVEIVLDERHQLQTLDRSQRQGEAARLVLKRVAEVVATRRE